MKTLRKDLRKHFAICIMLLVTVNIFNGCKEDEDPPAPTGPGVNEVWMQSNKFNPETRTIAVNTTITWTNKDGVDHNVVSSTSLFDSGIIPAGGTYSRQFTTAGTFPYTCTLHANMNGTIIVQ